MCAAGEPARAVLFALWPPSAHRTSNFCSLLYSLLDLCIIIITRSAFYHSVEALLLVCLMLISR